MRKTQLEGGGRQGQNNFSKAFNALSGKSLIKSVKGITSI